MGGLLRGLGVELPVAEAIEDLEAKPPAGRAPPGLGAKTPALVNFANFWPILIT